MLCWRWSLVGCRIWARPRLRSLASMLGLPASEIEKALLRMEASGAVLRGQFTGRCLAGEVARDHMSHSECLNWNGATGGCWRAFTG